MTLLRLVAVTAGRSPPVDADVAAGQWVDLTHPDPEALVAAVTGPTEGGRVLLGGHDLTARPPFERAREGLATSPGRLPDLPSLRVLDVLLLGGSVTVRGLSWRAALGSRRARTALAEHEAAVRALARRMGLVPWVEASAAGLPPSVAAAADLVRALAWAPRAVVWAVPPADDPDMLSATEHPSVRTAREVMAAEQRRLGFAVLAVTNGPAGGE